MKQFEVKVNEDKVVKGVEYLVNLPRAILLIITGMDEYAKRYETFAKELNKDKISVSVLDHFGQGENISSLDQLQKVPFDSWNLEIEALYLKILELKKLNVPVYLMGHSMGSFSTQCFIQRYPKLVDGVIIMGSNGINNKGMISFGAKLSKICARGKRWDKQAHLMQKAALGPYIKAIKKRRTDLDWLSYNKENVDNYINDPYCGAPNSNGFFCEMMKGMSSLYKKKNLLNISQDENILIVSGIDDPVGAFSKGPKALYKMYKRLNVKEVKLIIYKNMRHEILNENDKDKVINDIKEFIK